MGWDMLLLEHIKFSTMKPAIYASRPPTAVYSIYSFRLSRFLFLQLPILYYSKIPNVTRPVTAL